MRAAACGIRTCCNTLLHVGGGRVADYDGDLDDYARAVQRDEPIAASSAASSTGGSRKEERRERAEARAKLAPLRKQMQHIEKRMVSLGKDTHALEVKLADADFYSGASTAQLLDLSQQRATLASEIEALEGEWLHLQAELDAAEAA